MPDGRAMQSVRRPNAELWIYSFSINAQNIWALVDVELSMASLVTTSRGTRVTDNCADMEREQARGRG